MPEATLAGGGREAVAPDMPDSLLQGRRPRSCRRLNTDRCIQVARVLLGGGDAPWTTLIAKSCDEGAAPTPALGRVERLLFDREIVNYRFLGSLGDRFARFPRLLAVQDDAFFLEDLGPFRALRTDAEMMKAVADTFVRLHQATQDRESDYFGRFAGGLAARHGLLQGDQMLPSKNVLFAHGAQLFLDWAAVLAPTAHPALARHLARSRETIEDTPSYRAFVHDDLSSRRQSVIVGGVFYLLDFERAHFNHRLLDLAMIMVGKLEVIDMTIPIHIHPSLPPDLAEVYRRRWEDLRGEAIPDAEWRRHLLDALIYHVMVVISHIRIRAKHFSQTNMIPTISSVLSRFVAQSEAVDGDGAVRDAVQAVQSRLAIVPAGSR